VPWALDKVSLFNLYVCEKNTYSLFGISLCVSTSFTPNNISQLLKSSEIFAPYFSYSSFLKVRLLHG
jgi:hypothetical protein